MLLGVENPAPADPPHIAITDPGPPAASDTYFFDAAWRSAHIHHKMAHLSFPFDTLPIADTDNHPMLLPRLLGAPIDRITPESVWYGMHPGYAEKPESQPLPRFETDTPGWIYITGLLNLCAAYAAGNYLVGSPTLGDPLDILTRFRGVEALLLDLYERPHWVDEQLEAILGAWFAAAERLLELATAPDGSTANWLMSVWSPGRVGGLYCDLSALISPVMFRHFVAPGLQAQSKWLENSIYMLDGVDTLRHLDTLLEINSLDALFWLPEIIAPSSGSPEWYGIIRKIRAAGKALLLRRMDPGDVIPLLEAVGPEGLYLVVQQNDPDEISEIAQVLDQRGWRPYYYTAGYCRQAK